MSADVQDRLIEAFSTRPGVVPFDSPLHAAQLMNVFREAGLPQVAAHIEIIFWSDREGVRLAVERLRARDVPHPQGV